MKVASPRPEGQGWHQEANPWRLKQRQLVEAHFLCQRGTRATLVHGEPLIQASAEPWRRSWRVCSGPAEEEREQATHLPRKGILHECSAQKRLGAGPRISYVED